MDTDTFSVSIIPQDPDLTRPNGDAERPLNVVAVDPSSKSITVKYGGAYSGIYDWVVHSEMWGNLETTDVPLSVKIAVSSFTPT
jgi:hypothetical protein